MQRGESFLSHLRRQRKRRKVRKRARNIKE
jgi:hypothetical protein